MCLSGTANLNLEITFETFIGLHHFSCIFFSYLLLLIALLSKGLGLDRIKKVSEKIALNNNLPLPRVSVNCTTDVCRVLVGFLLISYLIQFPPEDVLWFVLQPPITFSLYLLIKKWVKKQNQSFVAFRRISLLQDRKTHKWRNKAVQNPCFDWVIYAPLWGLTNILFLHHSPSFFQGVT